MKILKYFISLAMMAGLMAACSKDLDEVSVYAPENVVAPSIHALDVTDIVITAKNQTESVDFAWDAADFGAPTAVNYSIVASYNGNKATVLGGITATQATVTYEQINTALALPLEDGGLGCSPEVLYEVAFMIGASVGATYPPVYSDSILVNVTPTAAEKQFDVFYVVGTLNGWDHGKVASSYDFLYNFSGDGSIFEGIVDFREAGSAAEFKFTQGDWGVAEHSMADGQTEKEPKELQLVSGGGSNINVYGANRYYHFTLNVGSKILTKNDAFDKIGVIGDFNGWGDDVEMTFNASKRRFYADVENLSGGFKFRANGGWDKNWGMTEGKLGNGGDNITVEVAGNYRVYLYLSESANIYYELNADMFGQEEGAGTVTPPTPPTPGPEGPEKEPNRWGLVGTLTSWGEQPDLYMDEVSEGLFVRKAVALTTEDAFKIRFNDAWDDTKNYGLNEGVEPVAPNTQVELLNAGGSQNIQVNAAGTYDVYFDLTNELLWVMTEGQTPEGIEIPEGPQKEPNRWGLVGTLTSWGEQPDLYMDEHAEGIYVRKAVALTTKDAFKVRFNDAWDDTKNYGLETEGTVAINEAVTLLNAGSSKNIMVDTDGTYDIYFDLTNGVLYVMTEGQVPEFGGGETPDPEQPATPAPLDIQLGIVGDHTGWATQEGVEADNIMEWNGTLYVAKNIALEAGKGFKVRKAYVWNDSYNWGPSAKAEVPVNGSIDVQNGSGSQDILVPATGNYDIYFDYAALKVWLMEAGAAAPEAGTPVTPNPEPEPEQPSTGGVEIPADVELGLCGDHTSWNSDTVMTLENGYYVAKGVALTAGEGFKVRKTGGWDDAYNFGPSAASEVPVNGSLDVINGAGSQNINVPATGTYDVYFDNKAMKVWLMEAGKTPAK